MKRAWFIATILLIGGCKGKDGEQGPAGASATSFIVTKSGPVTSDSISVTVNGLSISRGDLLNVYVCINSACVQIPAFQPGSGNNVFYIAQGSVVTISNALTGGQNLYYITALEKL